MASKCFVKLAQVFPEYFVSSEVTLMPSLLAVLHFLSDIRGFLLLFHPFRCEEKTKPGRGLFTVTGNLGVRLLQFSNDPGKLGHLLCWGIVFITQFGLAFVDEIKPCH